MVVVLFPMADELFEVVKEAAPDLVGGQLAEEALDHVEPRCRGGRKAQVEALMVIEPALHARMLVGGLVDAD